MKRRTLLAMGLAVTMTAGILTGCGSSEKVEKTLTADQRISSLEKAAPTVLDMDKEASKTQKKTNQTNNSDQTKNINQAKNADQAAAIPANVSEEDRAETVAAVLAQTEPEVKPENNDASYFEPVQADNISNTPVFNPKPSNEASTQAKSEIKPESKTETKTVVKQEVKSEVKPESSAAKNSEKVQPGNTSNTPASDTNSSNKNTSEGNGLTGNLGDDHANSAAGTTDKNNNSGSSADTAVHTHNWKEHTAERWVTVVATVEDEPAQYGLFDEYHMYWYDTGTWEVTDDPSRYDAWWEDMERGPLSPISIKLAEDPENHPLFLGYDEYGHASFLSDHYHKVAKRKTVPEVTHEEVGGYYETYVDYYYCECGAKK